MALIRTSWQRLEPWLLIIPILLYDIWQTLWHGAE
jgi:hypothetical protein